MINLQIWLIAGLMLWQMAAVRAQKIEINESPAIANLMNNWLTLQQNKPELEGWRVQIFSSTDRKKVEVEKLRFQNNFSNLPADWVHDKPYYKLRAGAFRTKSEAMATAMEWQHLYPSAFPVRDAKIPPREFLMVR